MRQFLLTLLLISGVTFPLLSQVTVIGGIVNQYRHVVAVGAPGTYTVTVTDASIFARNDTVLLIQMKGARIYDYESGSYGSYVESTGTPGAYEFIIIESVNTTTNNIVFTSGILKNYDVTGLVQLIKVPYYNSARVTSTVTCQVWDSTAKTGGVVAFIVGGTLTLEANIDVAGKGFMGGTTSAGDGVCVAVNPALYGKYRYPAAYSNSGFKGEGLAIRVYQGLGDEPSLFPEYAKGPGANFTAGGGGNGRFAGGGGGAGYGFGGNGGVEPIYCGAGNQGGNGLRGWQVKNTDIGNAAGIIMGGGGGSSTFLAGSVATSGARGGGIVIIVCDTIKGLGRSIIADGSSPSGSASGNAGAGGGGGGGSVAIYQQSFSTKLSTSALTISAKGGNGGNTSNAVGEGGGGGGGFILTNNIPFPSNVTRSVALGAVGIKTGTGSLTGTSGMVGEIRTTFVPLLNGFLFNTIQDSLTNNRVDSICSNTRPPKIIGTIPVGGSGSKTIEWQRSFESTFAAPVTLANDPDPVNYSPKLADVNTPTDTVWFRRIVRASGPPAITDISKPVKIIVHKDISNNIVGNQDTLCYNGDPPLLHQLMPDLVVPSDKYFFYSWQDSSSAGSWGTSLSAEKEYDPDKKLITSTWYRRKVTSGKCVDSSAIVRITVLPLISNNIIKSPAEDSICSGMKFQLITDEGSPAGGDNIYRYRWESNNNYTGWIDAEGVSNTEYHDPAELPLRIPQNDYVYRRIVSSGSNDVCIDTSNVIYIRDFPVISGNTIYMPTDNQPICSGYAPEIIKGNLPNNGNGYYTWQDSTGTSSAWKDIPGFINIGNPDFQAPGLSISTSFRRIAHSYGCSDTSNSIKISVFPPVGNNIISLESLSMDTIICNGQTPQGLIGTLATGGAGLNTYTYQWLDSIASAPIYMDIPGATLVNFPNPPALNVTTYYKRRVTSGGCSSKSAGTVTITVLAPISNNIITPADPAVCENTVPEPITSSSLSGGSGSYVYFWEQSTDGGANWAPAEGSNRLASYQPPSLSIAMKYRRTVTSGLADCCTNTSPEVDISINPKPLGPVNAGTDASIYSMERIYTMTADPPVEDGETGFWTVLEPGSGTFDNDADSKTVTRNLETGTNLFMWTITNGLCNIEDSVYIELLPDFIPQGFSPNGDAWNNKFIIEGLNLSDHQVAELSILNGAGTTVYSTSNRSGQEWNDWDGRNNKGNELPEGTYYYLLKVTTQDKQVIKKSGFVVLKRY